MNPYDILRGKTAVITGSGRGIGSAIALELASHGTNVAVNYFRHKEQAEETAAAVEAAGGQAIVVKAHVGEIAGVQRLVQTAAETFGGVDIFVGNAASGVLKPVLEQQLKGWDWTLNINARSILFGVQAAAAVYDEAAAGGASSASAALARPRDAGVQPGRRQQGGDRDVDPLSGGRTGAARHRVQCDQPRRGRDRGAQLTSPAKT